MPTTTNKSKIILAIKTIRLNPKLNCRTAAKTYNMPESTLRHKIKGRASLTDRRPSAQNLTENEKKVIIRYILDLDSRKFPPQIADMAAMADYILITRAAQPVGKQ